MRLKEYADAMHVTWKTANRWYHAGQIPGAWQTPSGSIMVPDPPAIDANNGDDGLTVVYARVSNAARRKTDLEAQAERLAGYCTARGWTVDKVVREVGSGLNDKRPKLEKILTGEQKVKRIVIEHRDRLTRFGYHYLELLTRARGTEIVCANPAEDDRDELLQDFTSIITSFCARIYGQRRGKRKTDLIKNDLNGNPNSEDSAS